MKKWSKHSEVTKQKLKSVERRRKPREWKKHSEESKKKISISRTWKWNRNSWKTGVFSEDALKRMSESAKKRWSNHTDVTKKKMSERMKWSDNPRFKPIWTRKSDWHWYILVKVDIWMWFKNREFEHIHFMELHIWRKINKRLECVHHINYMKDDNRIENLQLMTIKDHKKLHAKDSIHKHLSLK